MNNYKDGKLYILKVKISYGEYDYEIFTGLFKYYEGYFAHVDEESIRMFFRKLISKNGKRILYSQEFDIQKLYK